MTTPSIPSGLKPSLIRTLVPLLIGPLIARFGLNPDDPNTLLLAGAGLSYLYYVLVRVIETKYPKVGYLLGIAKAPAYSPAPAPQPEPVVIGTYAKPGGVPAAEFPDGDNLDSTTYRDI